MSFRKNKIERKITSLEDKVLITYLESTLEPLKHKQENYRLFIEYFTNKKKLRDGPEESTFDLEVLDEQLRVYNKLSDLYARIGNEGRALVYAELANKCEDDIMIAEKINASFGEVNEGWGKYLEIAFDESDKYEDSETLRQLHTNVKIKGIKDEKELVKSYYKEDSIETMTPLPSGEVSLTRLFLSGKLELNIEPVSYIVSWDSVEKGQVANN